MQKELWKSLCNCNLPELHFFGGYLFFLMYFTTYFAWVQLCKSNVWRRVCHSKCLNMFWGLCCNCVQPPAGVADSTVSTTGTLAAQQHHMCNVGGESTSEWLNAGNTAMTDKQLPPGRSVIEAIRHEKLISVDVPTNMAAGVATLRCVFLLTCTCFGGLK